MASYVEITPKPRKVGAQFIRAGAELTNLRAPLEQSVRRVVIPSIQENFFQGGRPQWEPLSDETISRRERESTGETPLVESGRGETHALSRARWRITRNSAEYPANWPSSSSYMKFQQTGAEFLPARPFATIQDEDLTGIEREFGRFLDHIVIARMLGL
jgi:phage gpG-like protein